MRGEFERELESKKSIADSFNKTKPVKDIKCVETEHWRNDPIKNNSSATILKSKKKNNGKDYSFV